VRRASRDAEAPARSTASRAVDAGAALGVRALYRRLLQRYGPQGWWPADDPFEMMIGAVLVQNTAWRNAQRAVAGLRDAGLLQWRRLAQAREDRIADAIRAAGTYRVKARRVAALARHVAVHGGPQSLAALPTPALRAGLLRVHGVGAETADAILVYAYARPSFVLDAYTRRVCARLGLAPTAAPRADAALRELLEGALPRDAALYGEFHALIVAHARASCRARPRCAGCALHAHCAFAASEG
jgi:endonuclease-3 related protein